MLAALLLRIRAHLVVWNILDERPLYLKGTIPLVLSPRAKACRVVERRGHLRDAAKLARGVDAKEEVDGALVRGLSVRGVESSIARVRRRPHAILDRLVHIVLGVGFDHEEASVPADEQASEWGGRASECGWGIQRDRAASSAPDARWWFAAPYTAAPPHARHAPSGEACDATSRRPRLHTLGRCQSPMG